MIIKSMSRKEPSFNQLLDYVESGRADGHYTIHHNLYGRDPEQVKEEFVRNARFLNRRVGGNYMYHEVISITRSDRLELREQKERLRQIVHTYIQERARHNLAYAALHDDKADNLHYHLIISSNEVGSKRRHRLSKREFDQIKKSLELRVLEHYPELGQKRLINQTAAEKLSNRGAELKCRTGTTPQREAVREKVERIFATAQTREELIEAFDKAGLDFYIRGNAPGVVDRATGRKHRIKTLGYLPQFETLNRKIETDCQQQSGTGDVESTAQASTQESPSPDRHKSDEKADTHDNTQRETEPREKEQIAKNRRDEMRQQRSSATDDPDSHQPKRRDKR